MAQEPEQLNLFDWQPDEKKPFRRWKIFKTAYFWSVAGLLVVIFVVWFNYASIRAFADDESTKGFFAKYWLIIFGTLAMILTFLAIWLIPKWQIRTLKDKKGGASQSEFDLEKERIKLRDDTRKTMAQIIGGAFFVLGLFVTYYTFDLNRQGQELTREGQVTERFSKAVALLKEPDVSVRLGGLYALERVAKDSPKDHSTVMEILAAFIREKSKAQREQFEKDEADKNNAKQANNIPAEQDKDNSLPVQTDVLAAVTIINRRNQENDKAGFVFNLSNANLRGVDLGGAKLNGVKLISADLSGAKVSSADLSSADLSNTDLNNADLINTKLNGAYLSNAKLNGADLRKANLNNAKLSGAKLNSTKLSGADLRRANLNFADFSFADLSNADLSNENLINTNLFNAILSGADLRFADLNNAKLSNADLSNAKLSGADLSNADLSGANLSSANLNFTKLSLAKLNGANLGLAKLYSTDLRYADLSTTINLNFEQISMAIINERTMLPVYLTPRRAELLELSKKNLEQATK